MAVDADTYGTVAKVQSMVGDLVSGRVFSVTSNPTLVQIEGFLDDTAAELNSALTFSEYTVPVVVGTDKAAFNYLLMVNSCGAAVLALNFLPAEAYSSPGEESPAQGRKQSFEKIYERALKTIRDRKLSAAKATGGSLLADLKIGSEKDSDGDTKNPLFKRSTTDFPSSRSLTTP